MFLQQPMAHSQTINMATQKEGDVMLICHREEAKETSVLNDSQLNFTGHIEGVGGHQCLHVIRQNWPKLREKVPSYDEKQCDMPYTSKSSDHLCLLFRG